jgi:hypothetical protein
VSACKAAEKFKHVLQVLDSSNHLLLPATTAAGRNEYLIQGQQFALQRILLLARGRWQVIF